VQTLVNFSENCKTADDRMCNAVSEIKRNLRDIKVK
jgi:hypothetical protein